MDIRMYKDNNDLIIVFKNATADIKDLVSSLIASAASGTPTEPVDVPELSPVPEEQIVPPQMPDGPYKGSTPNQIIALGFDGFLYLSRRLRDDKNLPPETVEEIKRVVLEYYHKHNKLKTESVENFKVEQAKSFTESLYPLSDKVLSALELGKYPNIQELFAGADEEFIKGTAQCVASDVVNFFESLE